MRGDQQEPWGSGLNRDCYWIKSLGLRIRGVREDLAIEITTFRSAAAKEEEHL